MNIEFDPDELLASVEELKQLYNNIGRMKDKLYECSKEINTYWQAEESEDFRQITTGLTNSTNRLNSYVNLLVALGNHLEEYAISIKNKANNVN